MSDPRQAVWLPALLTCGEDAEFTKKIGQSSLPFVLSMCTYVSRLGAKDGKNPLLKSGHDVECQPFGG